VQTLAELLSFVNTVLLKSRLNVPVELVTSINHTFGSEFSKLQREVMGIVNDVEFDAIPQLQYIEPKYKEVLRGPSPRCISALLYGNKVNVDLTSRVLEMCDRCMLNLEIVSCNMV
jgi:hypothetical protein